jgi:hypothetical protein
MNKHKLRVIALVLKTQTPMIFLRGNTMNENKLREMIVAKLFGFLCERARGGYFKWHDWLEQNGISRDSKTDGVPVMIADPDHPYFGFATLYVPRHIAEKAIVLGFLP